MIFTYIFISVVVAMLVTVIGGITFFDEVDDKEEFKLWAAAMTIGYFLAVIWPLAIPLAIMALVGYGLYNIPNLIRTIRADME